MAADWRPGEEWACGLETCQAGAAGIHVTWTFTSSRAAFFFLQFTIPNSFVKGSPLLALSPQNSNPLPAARTAKLLVPPCLGSSSRHQDQASSGSFFPNLPFSSPLPQFSPPPFVDSSFLSPPFSLSPAPFVFSFLYFALQMILFRVSVFFG